eukprot:4800985-Lingulodinium_polyedra.AAC.1
MLRLARRKYAQVGRTFGEAEEYARSQCQYAKTLGRRQCCRKPRYDGQFVPGRPQHYTAGRWP